MRGWLVRSRRLNLSESIQVSSQHFSIRLGHGPIGQYSVVWIIWVEAFDVPVLPGVGDFKANHAPTRRAHLFMKRALPQSAIRRQAASKTRVAFHAFSK